MGMKNIKIACMGMIELLTQQGDVVRVKAARKDFNPELVTKDDRIMLHRDGVEGHFDIIGIREEGDQVIISLRLVK